MASKSASNRSESLIRKTWPKIRVVWITGKFQTEPQKFFQVDARRKGTDGKRETFTSEEAAKQRANEIAGDFVEFGGEGLQFPAELRGMALTGARMLEPYGKTILQACEFLKAHLDAAKAKQASETVKKLASSWLADKESGKNKKLRPETLRQIRLTSDTLIAEFGERRILDMSQKDMRDYLDRLEVGLRRKFNVRSQFSQFFNWCMARGYLASNPCENIEVSPEGIIPEETKKQRAKKFDSIDAVLG